MAKKKKIKFDINTLWGVSRITLGLIFIWPFFDKLLGLGFSTCRDEKTNAINFMCEKAMISGGSPTTGFLKFGTEGPLANLYQSMAGNTFIDYLFMAALLGIGVALILGIGVRIATISGILLVMMMWSAALPKENNPILDEHIIYALLFAGLLGVNNKQQLGFGRQWAQLDIVKRLPILK